jgi:hypothetical protein
MELPELENGTSRIRTRNFPNKNTEIPGLEHGASELKQGTSQIRTRSLTK